MPTEPRFYGKTPKEVANEIATELVRDGMDESQARERANNIVQECLGGPVDYRRVAQMIEPSDLNTGIPDPITRARTATQALAIYLDAISDSIFSLNSRLVKYCKLQQWQASEWILRRRREN